MRKNVAVNAWKRAIMPWHKLDIKGTRQVISPQGKLVCRVYVDRAFDRIWLYEDHTYSYKSTGHYPTHMVLRWV